MEKYYGKERLFEKLEQYYDEDEIEDLAERFKSKYQKEVDSLRSKGIEPNLIALEDWFIPWNERNYDILFLYEAGLDPNHVSMIVDREREENKYGQSDYLDIVLNEYFETGKVDGAITNHLDIEAIEAHIDNAFNSLLQ